MLFLYIFAKNKIHIILKNTSIMKLKILLVFSLTILNLSLLVGQDTFSIVAVDSITGEVGSAAASCVDLTNYPNYTDDFLGELFPGVGAINTQAYYNQTNQANARNRMNLGETPNNIIQWLIENDVSGQPQIRQYGIVAMVDGSPQSAAHTGTSTDDYKNHITAPNYSIQGNILLGQVVLDSMESRFLNAEGDLACKLMAALQGAKMVGADSRCTANGTSSLFAFIKVAQPTDIFGSPSFLVSVRTANGANIEPIDTLQVLFDEIHDCNTVGINYLENDNSNFSVYPNPAKDILNIEMKKPGSFQLRISDLMGYSHSNTTLQGSQKIDISNLSKGIYLITISNKGESFVTRIVKQ